MFPWKPPTGPTCLTPHSITSGLGTWKMLQLLNSLAKPLAFYEQPKLSGNWPSQPSDVHPQPLQTALQYQRETQRVIRSSLRSWLPPHSSPVSHYRLKLSEKRPWLAGIPTHSPPTADPFNPPRPSDTASFLRGDISRLWDMEVQACVYVCV